MAHNRKLVLGAVDLVMGHVRDTIPAMTQIRDELEKVLIEAGWFPTAPFKWVGLVFRYGLKMDAEPHFQRVNKKHGDLPIAIEVDTHRLLELQGEPEALKVFLKTVAVRCLLSVARKYQLPSGSLVAELEELDAA